MHLHDNREYFTNFLIFLIRKRPDFQKLIRLTSNKIRSRAFVSTTPTRVKTHFPEADC